MLRQRCEVFLLLLPVAHCRATLPQSAACLAPILDNAGRTWASPSADGVMLQHFSINLQFGAAADSGAKTRAALLFSEPFAIDKITGGRAYVTECIYCSSAFMAKQSGVDVDGANDAGCMTWCNQWTCTNTQCTGCGASKGCYQSPSPPAPSPQAPPPLAPGTQAVQLTLLTVADWHARLEGERAQTLAQWKQLVREGKVRARCGVCARCRVIAAWSLGAP